MELATRAVRDLRRIDAPERRRIVATLEALPAANADIKPLAGQFPWQRLRVGDWRVRFRPLTDAEAAAVGGPGPLVARVVNRRDLLRAVREL